jgi:hypothetical protein
MEKKKALVIDDEQIGPLTRSERRWLEERKSAEIW